MSNAGRADPDVLEDLPPSAVLVYKTLAREGPMCVKDLRETAYLADKTARRALDRLAEHDLVTSRPGHDARETHYQINK